MQSVGINKKYLDYLGEKLKKALSKLFLKYTDGEMSLKETLIDAYELFKQDYIIYFGYPEFITSAISKSVFNVINRTDYKTNTVAVNFLKIISDAYWINPRYHLGFCKSLRQNFRVLEKQFNKPVEIAGITISTLENDIFFNKISNDGIFVNEGTAEHFAKAIEQLIEEEKYVWKELV